MIGLAKGEPSISSNGAVPEADSAVTAH